MNNVLTDYEIKNVNTEDLEDFLGLIESSFGIEFMAYELMHIKTFGQLFDHIENKVQLKNVDDCTSQQAFYKLRSSILVTVPIDGKKITTDFPLSDLLPRHRRRSKIAILEKHLGYKLNILRPPHLVTGTLVFAVLASFAWLFVNWQIGLLAFIGSIALNMIANKIGKEFDLQTVGQVAEKMTRENYLKSRRTPTTFNKKEINKILTEWFSKELALNLKLTR